MYIFVDQIPVQSKSLLSIRFHAFSLICPVKTIIIAAEQVCFVVSYMLH